jgi:hypothetical protein
VKETKKMSDDLVIKELDEPRMTGRLNRAEDMRNHFVHYMQPGEDWRSALQPSFWLSHLHRLEPGSLIEIHSADHEIQINLHVLESNKSASYLRLGVSPSYPADLVLPKTLSSAAERPRYGIRRCLGEANLFNIIDNFTDMAVERSLDRLSADSGALARNTADKEARALADRDRATFAVTDVTDEGPAVSPEAARTRAYRARQRAEAAQGAAT